MLATHARRASYVLAGLALNVELFDVWHFPSPDWYARAVIQAVSFGGICWVALAAALELIARRARGARAQWFMLVFAAMPLYYTFFECAAVWQGRAHAEVQTWHLISLFTITHFFFALVAAAFVVG